jgi:uncharacterized 2Fe-2S/4Fe-4S cluster protein (DUF4445 family)
MMLMNFTIEFQPQGIHLVCSEPLTILDAARQAGIPLRADCGGEGICGKCRVKLLSDPENFSPTEVENRHLSQSQINDGFRLACETVVSKDLRVYIPDDSTTRGQILQTSGEGVPVTAEPAIQQFYIQVPQARLDDPRSDIERIQASIHNNDLQTGLDVLHRIPRILRANDWKINLFVRGNEIIHVSEKPVNPLVGLAVDVGSTKLACYLVELPTGRMLAAKGVPNPQIAYGEDIMARLAFAQKGIKEAHQLHKLVIQAIYQAAEEMCRELKIPHSSIGDACLVGNTAMHHLFLNLPTDSLAFSPFVPVTTAALHPPGEQIGLTGMPGMAIYTPPVIAGFVGSDHLAFLLASGFGQDQRTRLGIDIGTNTEIALQKGDRIVSVSTASGPAFEGAHIRYGMRAAPGAIEHVHIDQDNEIKVEVIGQGKPIGICGSGILDAVGEMRVNGVLNSRGRLDKTSSLVKINSDGKPFVILAEGGVNGKTITLSQADIDQVLLAKGAIRAGIDVLMDNLKVSLEDINEIVIAGAFGTYMLPEQAMRIGMLPAIQLDKVHIVGNAAGFGARMMLISQSARKNAQELAKKIEYLELTLYPDFEMFYARGISF